MNNFQIIAVGTLISITLNSLISNFRLKKSIKTKETSVKVIAHYTPQRGFIDYKTGRRVDIVPNSKKEVFVD